MKSGDIGNCPGCLKEKRLHAAPGGKGEKVCNNCYQRWRRLGKPDVLPLARGQAWKSPDPELLEAGPCGSCRRPVPRRFGRKGLCRTCYNRWLELGQPDVLPPKKMKPLPASSWELSEFQLGKARELQLLIDQGVTRILDQAARMGVSREMVRHYRKWLREAGGDVPAVVPGDLEPRPERFTEHEIAAAQFSDEEMSVAESLL